MSTSDVPEFTESAAEPIVLSWSGGKDSALALAALRANRRFDVVALLTTVTAGYDRISIHGVRRTLLERQIRALRLPLHEVVLQPGSSNEQYEAALELALQGIRQRYPIVRRIAFGDLFLEDVRQYREDRLPRLGFECVFPIWGQPTSQLAEDFIDAGFEARLVCVDTTQLDGRFAGRAFDRHLLAELPPGADRCGERGEFHTFVAAGPIFDAPVAYAIGEHVLRDGRFMYCDLLPDGD